MYLYWSYKTVGDPKEQGKSLSVQRNNYNWFCYKCTQSEADPNVWLPIK